MEGTNEQAEETSPPETTDDFAATVAERVAAESSDAPKPKGRRGRPPGTKNKPKEGDAKQTVFVAHVTDGEIAMAGNIFAVVWGFIAPIARVAPLNEAQTKQAGEALAPLVQKYMPVLGAWQYEIGAVVVIASIAFECKRNYVPPTETQEPPLTEAAVKRDSFGRVVQ